MTYFCLPGFRHFAPSLVEFVVGLSMSSASSPIYVRYVGHIHVYWLDAFAGSANLLAGFDTRGRPCDVRYLGRRGATLGLVTLFARANGWRGLLRIGQMSLCCIGVGTLSVPKPITVALDIQRLALKMLATS